MEPYSIAAQVCMKANGTSDDIALIMGAGPIGLAIIDVLTHVYKIDCISCDVISEKLDKAKAIGAKYIINLSEKNLKQELKNIVENGLANITIDTACTSETFGEAIQVTSCAGSVVVLGFNPATTPISQLEITRKELTIVGSRQQCGQFPKVIGWMKNGMLHPQIILSHEFSIDNVLEGFSLLEKSLPDVCKIIIDWEK